MRLAEFSVARRGVVDSRRMQFADQRCRQQMLAVELAFAEVQPHPVREAGDRGVDRAGRGGADRQAHGRQPRILVHHVRPRRLIRGFEIVQTEADGPTAAMLTFVNARRAVGGKAAVNVTGAALVTEFRLQRAIDFYLTGQRLGDLRRYSAGGTNLFPTGKYPVFPDPYGSATCFIVPLSEKTGNPNYKG